MRRNDAEAFGATRQDEVDAVDTDLDVLLAELNRVRAEAADAGALGPSADEAITLAAAATRLVDMRLRLRSPHGASAAGAAGASSAAGAASAASAASAAGDGDGARLSQAVLQSAHEVLLAALKHTPDPDPDTAARPSRRRGR